MCVEWAHFLCFPQKHCYFVITHPSSKSLTVSTFWNINLVNIFSEKISLLPLTNTSLLSLLPLVPAHFADNSDECYFFRALCSVGPLAKSIGNIGAFPVLID